MDTKQNYYIRVDLQDYEDNNLDVHVYKQYHDDIGILIEQFHKEHTWDKMYTVEDCYDRFENNMFCMIWYCDDIPTGICWYHPLNENIYFMNFFVSRKRPKGKTSMFLSKSFYDIFEMGYFNVFLYVDGWNIKMKKIMEKINGVEIITKEEFDKLTESVKKYTYI